MKLHSFFESLRELRTFLLLFTTQALSSLGSAMTSYALVIWAYQQSGSALSTALLTVSSYAPYVVFSLFCGALVDRLDTRRCACRVHNRRGARPAANGTAANHALVSP